MPKTKVSTLEIYAWFVAKEKAIYNALNMMKARSSTYIAFLWAPLEKEQVIQQTINQFGTTEFKQVKRTENEQHIVAPPTYIKSNELTYVFQEITNTYGVPSYQEANPSAFSIVTFPFLFAVMFGDYGHGSLLFVVGVFLVLMNDRLKHTAVAEVCRLRYILTMMGFFSMYNGLLYNEFFAMPNDWFGTCFNIRTRTCTTDSINCNAVYWPNGCVSDPQIGQDPDCLNECVYPFGVDPAWFLSDNLLTFTNSMKMKISVIIGILHMSMGVVTKGANAVYFGRWVVFFSEVLTGLIIMLGLFGWMDILIFAKWSYVMEPYSYNPTN